MKRMIILITVFCLLAGMAFAEPAYYSNKVLFSLKGTEQPLTSEQIRTLVTPYPGLNKLIQKYNVVKIEPWLPNARDIDHDGDVYLNRIYRLITKGDMEAPLAMANAVTGISGGIQHAELEPVMQTHATPDDPRIGSQWYLSKAQVREAWKLWDIEGGETPGNRNVVVAVVDDGMEYTHPDLWKNIWINQDEIPDVYYPIIDTNSDGWITAEELVAAVGDISGNGVADLKDVISTNSFILDNGDTDSDGYVDNIIGWDTNADGGNTDDDRDPMVKNNEHGTHVGGLVGATTNNATGIASAAYNISIMPVKATGDETIDQINTGWDGILYAAQAGADIINCSWGGNGYSSYSQNLINTAYNTYGSLIVAAAGNGDDYGNPSDEPHYPSGYNNVVSVTAVSSSDIFSWANYGAADPASGFYGVDISAPGESMLSTILTKNSSYGYKMGTSMASPFVASCFALLKSVYPDSSNEWLIDRMLSNTDPIDDKNPDYAGQIGTGRVNILKALVSDKWPSLSVEDQVVTVLSGDGDSVLNPGESVRLMVEVKNDTGWAAASNVIGTLRTSEEGINVIDSVALWSSIPQNNSALNDGDGFSISFSNDMLPGSYDFELRLESATDYEFAYNFNINLTVSISLDQEGFPFSTSTDVEASPLFTDTNNDGLQEIVVGDKGGNLYVIDHESALVNGFPVSLGSSIKGVAVADIDLDDTLEIVVTAYDKKVAVYDITGKHEWSQLTGLFIIGMPSIGNLDIDPQLEIVAGSYDRNIYAFNHDGTLVPGFPRVVDQPLHGGMSVVDLDGDAKDDIVFLGRNGQAGVIGSDGNMMAGWPVNTGAYISSEPQVVITGDTSAIILWGNDLGDMYAYNIDGTQRFMIDGIGAINASPAIYGNGDEVYAFFASAQGYIYGVDIGTGTVLDGWPKQTSQVYQSLSLADVSDDDNNEPQVLAMGNDGYVYAFDLAGNTVNGFPLNTNHFSKSSLAVTDIDMDDDIDIIAGNYTGISVIDIKNHNGKVHWPMHRGGPERSGAVTTTWTGIADDMDIPDEDTFNLIGNAPNPFNPETVISYRIGKAANVKLTVLSLNGKKLLTKDIKNASVGTNEIYIDMAGFPSGIYLYTLEHMNTVRSSKMIFLK